MAARPALNISAPKIDFERGTGFVMSLPEQAGMLTPRLQDIARQYLGARRRSGEALLDMCHWLNEAKLLAKHGEWKIFLEATGTSDDTAERLLNIHRLAQEHPQFAEAIRANWLTQSAAALLARESTPPELIDEVLSESERPTKAGIEARVRKPKPAQNPHSADFDDDPPPPERRGQRTRQLESPLGRRSSAAIYEHTEAVDQAQGAPLPSDLALHRPRRPVSADVSAHTDYVDRLEAYASALEQIVILKRSTRAPQIDAARAFATQQRALLAQWNPSALVRPAAYRQALDHIDALIALLEEGGDQATH